MKPTLIPSTLRFLTIRLALLLVALFVQQSVRADIQTWWGASTNSTPFWNDAYAGNWTNAEGAVSIPANGDSLIFANPSPQSTTSNNFAALTVSSLVFSNGNFDLFGDLLTITGGITNAAPSPGDNIFDLPLSLSGAQTFEVDGGSLTFNQVITNNGNLTINGMGSSAGNLTWSNGYAASGPVLGLRGSGNLIVNSNVTLTINGGFLYPTASFNFAGNTIVNYGGTLNMNASDFDSGSQIGQALTINPGGTVNEGSGAPHIAGASGRPLSIYGGTLTMSGDGCYWTTVILSNAAVQNVSGSSDIRGNGSFTNLASPSETIFGVALNLTSSRVVGVDSGGLIPDIDFQGNGTVAVEGSGTLTKVGPGVMQISGPDTHTGSTTISAGTLALTSTMANTPLITVANNAVFDVSSSGFSPNNNQILAGVGTVVGTVSDQNSGVTGAAISPGGNGVAGSLLMGGLSLQGNGLALNFDLAKTTGIGGGTNDLLIVTNLTLSGNGSTGSPTNIVNINFLNSTPLVGGTYTLILYTNGNGLAAGPVYTLAAAASRYSYSFFSDGASIKVTVTGAPGNLVWTGDNLTNNWDINTSSNWLLGATSSAFLQGDNVTFNDSGSTNPPVNIVGAVQPTVITVSNNTRNYVFNGSGNVAGGSLQKTGSGSLTILNANTASGGGSLNGTGTVTVGDGSTTVANLGSGPMTNNTKVTFFENASVTYAGNMSGTGSLVANMPGATLSLTGTNTFSGGLVAANGSLQIGANPAVTGSSVSGPITNYSALYFSRTDVFTNQSPIITSAGNTREYGNGDIYVRGGTPASGGMTVDGTGGPISAGGSLNVGASFYGKLTINPGANITVANTMNVGDSSAIAGDVIQNGGTLNVNGYGTVKVLSIGLYGSEISTYNMNGGILNVPNAMIDVGSDGIGLLNLTGGTVSCTGLAIDNNGSTTAIGITNSTFSMTGGQLNLGVNGISASSYPAANAIPTNHTVVLAGGTIAATAPAGWSTVFNLWLTNGSPTFDTTNATVTLSGGLYGNGGLTKQGIGCLNLNNATNSYTGTTTVAAGTLQGSGTIVGPIIVNSGANISAGTTLATGTLTTSNLTVNAGGNVVIDASSTAATSDLLYVKGPLTLSSTPLTFNFLGGTPYTGSAYTILSNLVSPRTGTLVYNNPTRYAATLDQTQPNRIQVSFSGANASLVWQGATSPNWNVNDANWLNNGVLDKYYQSDAVVFDNTGITQSNVTLSAAMTPASVAVDTTGNYTFSGSPIAGVTTLTKSGSGLLTLLNTNAYTGVTTIAGGTLQVGNGVSSGALPTNGVVDNYGSLVFNNPALMNFNGAINGPGSLTQAGSGTLLITATQNHYGGTTINPGSTIQLGNGTFADSGSLGNGPVTNNGAVIFNRAANVSVAAPYTGGGSFTFLGTGYGGQSGYILNATNTFTGPVTLSLARIQSGAGAQSFGSPSSISVSAGSQVYAVATPASSLYNIPLTLAGTGWADGLGALRIEGGGTWAGNITLANNARIGVNNATTNSITGSIAGNYELETYGGSAATKLILAPASSANSYNALRVSIGTAGATTIAGNANAIPNNIPLTMNGGTLWLNGFSKSFSPYLNLSSSSSIQNGSPTSPATVTLAPVLGSSTSYTGSFADGSTQPLNVTLTQTPGLWTLPMSTTSPNWTGNFTNNGGAISCGTQNTVFGSQGVVGRSIVGNNGAVFTTTLNNVLNGYSGNVVLNNSTWICNRYISMAGNAGYLALANSTMTGTNGQDGSYENFQLPSTVLVRGTGPSYLLGIGSSSAFDLQSGGTTFDVAHVAGGANSDLFVGGYPYLGYASTTFLHSPAATTSGGSLIKVNTGILELDGANTYTGPTTISQGTLRLGASATLASSGLSIASGAYLDVSALSGGLNLNVNQTISGSGAVLGSLTDASGTSIQPGGVGVAGTLTITNNLTLNGVGALAIDLANNTGSGNDKIVVGGTLALSSSSPTPVNFNFLNSAPALGTPYTLFQCGAISGTPATALTNALAGRYTTTFAQSGNNITVTFSGSVSNLVWTGSDPLVPLTWDVAVSTNWTDASGGGDVFYAMDTVRFDDSPANTVANYTNVTLNVTVNPAAIVVNTTNAYNLPSSGSGVIAGNTSLTMTNTGALILGGANTFTGPVTVQSGTLSLAGTSPLGANLNSVTVSNGATVDFNGDSMGSSNTRGYNFMVGGSGPDGNGALRNSGGGIYSYANVSILTLTADTIIGGNNGRWDIGSGSAGQTVNGNGHNLTKIGSFQMDFRPQYITNLASFTITNGSVYDDSSYSFTNPATANTTINLLGGVPGVWLGINSGATWNMPLVVSNASVFNNSGSGSVAWLGNVAVLATNEFGNSGSQVFAGVVSGPGAINIGGSTTAGAIPGILTFSNVNTFSGGLTISNAPVTLPAATAVSGFAGIVVTSSNGLGTGPITFNLSLMTTNTMTNTARLLECNVTGGGVIPNNIILPSSGAIGLGVTNVGIQGRDSSSVFTLAGQISGGFAGLTNWVDFGDASSFGVMRLANTGNSFLGAIYCDRGVLAITGDGCLGNAANTLFLNQGSANGGLRFDAPNINVAHNVIWNTASTISVYGDNDGDGVPEVANNATISGNISSIATAQGLNIGGGTNIAGTCYGSLTLSGSNTFNNQITINANTKLIAASTNALGATGYYGIVSQGGTLSLANVGAFVNRQIQFSGPGVLVGGVGVGALENLAGTNVYSAALSLNAASSFGVTAGSLNLTAGISGAYPLTKVGPGPLILTATESYSAGTFVSAGTLVVNGSLPVGNAVNVASGAMLGGSGTINGPITTQSGAVLMPGGGLVPGKLTVNNTLNLAGNTVMYLNNSATPATNSLIAGVSTVYYGGALSVTNLGTTASLTNGCRFTLFSAVDHQGSFAVTNLPALASGLGWSNSLALDGSIEVVAVNTENPLPGPIAASVNNSTLTLSWPTNSGWTLQMQTNSLSAGLGTNWVDVPGSSSVTTTNIQIDATKPTVFYRLRY